MEPGPPELKRPRLNTLPPTWSEGTSQHGGVSLPPPTSSSHHPPPPPPSGPQHPLPPGPHHIPHPPPPAVQHPSYAPYQQRPGADLPPSSTQHHHFEDRRHHDPDPYSPMQDTHRQPPPSPAHPPYNSYHPREVVVKRDPSDDAAHMQMRRPNSTGNAPDGLPGTPHVPQHPAQHPEDPRRHMSFDAGPAMAHSPTLYRQPQSYAAPPPQTPVAHHPQYDQPPHAYGPPAPMAEVYGAPVSTAQANKKKATRASTACDSCRSLKAKCDEQKPCKNCKEKNIECKYRETQTKQPDKFSTDVMEMLAAIKDTQSTILNRVTRLEGLVQSGRDPAMKLESVEQEEHHHQHHDPQPMMQRSPSPIYEHQTEEASHSSMEDPVAEPNLTSDEAQATLRTIDDDEMEIEPGPPVAPHQPAMPVGHTTLATTLLKWPAIQRLMEEMMPNDRIYHVDEFPIRQEQQRGILRVYGRGEGSDQEMRQPDKETPADTTNDMIQDDSSDITSPSPNGEAWGQVGGMTPPSSVDYVSGPVNSDGNPDYEPAKVWKYVQSFKDNILNMHPIIIPKELDAMVKLFLDNLPRSDQKQNNKSNSVAAKFVGQGGPPQTASVEAGMKRKRSSPGAEESNPTVAFQKPGRPFRTVHTALVLMVLALGKMCSSKGKIPDVVPEKEGQVHSSPSIRNGAPISPLHGSPPGFLPQSHSSGLPSPKEQERVIHSRRSSLQGAAQLTKGTHTMKRNIDAIYGLEYFAIATDILGGHMGGYTLKHVYVYLLAGLYYGQLGRVLESYSSIVFASHKLLNILRPSLARLKELNQPHHGITQRRDNQLAFAFWTCLQLESDLLAELNLSQSGILAYEDIMPYPNTSLVLNPRDINPPQLFSQPVLESYMSQLYLRKQLNAIHSMLYSPTSPAALQQPGRPTIEQHIHVIQGSLKDSRQSWIPEGYRFNDGDPPANEILNARLRAKYWGSQVILYRPFVKLLLNGEELPIGYLASAPPQYGSEGMDLGGLSVPENMDPRVVHYARLGVEALVESTRAFHGLNRSHRPIITNVFGTAHAQWGNLLTLSACYRDPVLAQFIDAGLLAQLLARTIDFFKLIALPSSALYNELNMLILLFRGFNFSQDSGPGSSFSSVASGAHLPPIQNLEDMHQNQHANYSHVPLPPPSMSHSMS